MITLINSQRTAIAGKGKPFAPGKSGNPKGRPKKGLAIADMLSEIGDETTIQVIDGKEVKITKKKLLMRNTYQRAIEGEAFALTFIGDRLEGKARQIMEIDIDQKISMVEVAQALSESYTEGKIAEA